MTQTRPRIARLKAAMAAEGIDALICFKPEHTFYLSGFNPIIYSHPVIVILPLEGDPVLMVHALRDDHGRSESWVTDIRLYGAWSTKVTMGPNWQEALASVLDEKGVRQGTIGLEEDAMPLARYRVMQGILPGARLVDSSEIFDRCRLIKDPDEIANARIAATLADHGMDAAVEAVAQGCNEREISTLSMAAMNRYWTEHLPDVEVADFGTLEGGAQNGLWTWTLAGDRMFRNCDNSSLRQPKRGETVAIFIWAVANGIHAENERTVAYGPIPAANRRALDTILKIREDIAPLMRPGTPLAELFNVTKRGLEAAGYAANIPGRIGHTIGIGAHEHTSLDAKSTVVLQPGMMFTLEPNLRVPAENVATQISDTILITDTGHEFLTRSRGGYLEV
ncbi:M24 family metallopeptidase [Frigidibacter albus]|uniref:M24 family metallopeptidase n=1 Tax=Frigidibacter albus TaxID=1465486 RepID=A0A6L8VFU0_9RHOB|nr:Xaa-Pro peptidase family protein [Frigidibacter albus]MZQ89185.1 M24 family metallopeptidase [Frigidibacter albus]NBE30758.1 M24 family metallopeptidase [Frigidibacter albus]GGH50886.1 integrase [Frigidibacter albus]